MPSDPQTAVFIVTRPEEDEESPLPIGKVAADAQGKLRLIEADEIFDEFLQSIIDSVNEKEEFRIKIPPPPGSEPGSLHARTAGRAEPDVTEVVRVFLNQRHGLVLAPSA